MGLYSESVSNFSWNIKYILRVLESVWDFCRVFSRGHDYWNDPFCLSTRQPVITLMKQSVIFMFLPPFRRTFLSPFVRLCDYLLVIMAHYQLLQAQSLFPQ